MGVVAVNDFTGLFEGSRPTTYLSRTQDPPAYGVRRHSRNGRCAYRRSQGVRGISSIGRFTHPGHPFVRNCVLELRIACIHPPRRTTSTFMIRVLTVGNGVGKYTCLKVVGELQAVVTNCTQRQMMRPYIPEEQGCDCNCDGLRSPTTRIMHAPTILAGLRRCPGSYTDSRHNCNVVESIST